MTSGTGEDAASLAENEQTNSILSRKLINVLDSQLENDLETQEALRELSKFFTENTIRNRRNLRGEIERQSLNINLEFLHHFEQVKQAVDEIYSHVSQMTAACHAMQEQLHATKSKAQDLIEQTSTLQNREKQLVVQARMVDDFLIRYQLTAEEIQCLTGQSSSSLERVDMSEELFSALEKAQHVHKDCRSSLLPMAETTALEIMDQMNQYQDAGLQKLYRWAIQQSRTFDTGMSSGDTLKFLARCTQHLLSERPALFKLVLEEYCSSRKSNLARSFIEALTVGGVSGTPRPIEWQAHDPQRYIGDMLAWLHQAMPSESENVHVLLKNCPDHSIKGDNTFDKEDVCEEILANITEGLCRPLRNRIEQILVSEHGAVVIYRLTNLIRFYCDTLKQVITAKTAPLIQTLEDLDQMAYSQFFSLLQAQVQQLTSSLTIQNSNVQDLGATQSTVILLTLLKDIMSSTSVMEEQPSQMDEIVGCVVEPLIRSLLALVGSHSSTDQDVFMLNSIYQIHSTLSLFKGNDARLANLNLEMDLRLDTLSSEQTSHLIVNLGLQPICTLISSLGGNSSSKPLCQVEGMDPASLQQFLSKFDNFLVAPDVYLLPQIRLLASSTQRKVILKRSLQVVSASYRQLFEAVHDARHAYPEGLMEKTPEQVDLLLQV